MKTFLTIVGVTLAVVIVAVAGVYGWTMFSTPPTADRLPAPPQTIAQRQPASAPAPSASADTTPSHSAAPATHTPSAAAPPAERNLLPPSPPPPTQVANPTQGMIAPETPAPEAPVESDGTAPDSDLDAPPETFEDKLYAVAIGQTLDEVDAVMGGEGTPDDTVEFVPQGWYTLRWRDSGGATITGTFDENDRLVAVVPFKVPGAFEWMNDDLNYSIVTWLNDRLEALNFPVRVPAVRIAEVTQTQYQFQAGLVTLNGQVVGSIGGNYYEGDGVTTVAPGDTRPYVRAMEGSYQFTAPNGAQVGDTFALAEY